MSDQIHIRHYEPSDYETLSEWWHAHGKHRRPEPMLPKCGVVCEIDGKPVSALFLHMDNSCGMCMADHAVSAPGLSLKTALLAFKHSVACLKKIALELGYHTMAVFTYPGIARVLERQGFREMSNNQIAMIASTTGEEL
jgi:hypothetical protein